VPDSEQIEELNTGLLLSIPYRAMEARVFKAMAAAGHNDFTPAQARVFQRIAPGGSRLTDLAEQALITKQSAGFLVDQLERAGYVERVPDPSDARARLVRDAPACGSPEGGRRVRPRYVTPSLERRRWRFRADRPHPSTSVGATTYRVDLVISCDLTVTAA
jgi:hypothetical protein